MEVVVKIGDPGGKAVEVRSEIPSHLLSTIAAVVLLRLRVNSSCWR